MTVEHAHSVDNGVYQQHPLPQSGAPSIAGPVVEFLDEEHGGYKTPDPHTTTTSSFTTKLHHLLVLHDFQNAEVWRAAIFEGTASFAMVFLGVLSTVSTLNSAFAHPTVLIAILQGLILSSCILAAAPATGGHVNPVITWTEMLTGHISPPRGALYILAQILGSIAASLAAKHVTGEELATRFSLGGCYLKSQTSSGVVGLDTQRALLLEFVLVFFVLFVSYSVALDPPRLPRVGYIVTPFMIGGLVGLGIFAGAGVENGYGGAGINPGRCIGPAVALGGEMWRGHWVFWVGPAAAGVVMAVLYRFIPPTHVQVYKLREKRKKKKRSRFDRLFADPKSIGYSSSSEKQTV